MNPVLEAQLIEAIKNLNAQLAHPPSDPARVILSLIPAFGIVFGSVLLFFFFYWHFSIRRELIRAGLYRPSTFRNFRVFCLLVGSLATFVGIPMTVLFYALQGLTYAMLGGLIPLGAGLGFLVFYALASREN